MLLTKQGTFAAETSAGSKPYTGIGFRPKAVIFWATALTAPGFGTGRSFTLGWAVDGQTGFQISQVMNDAATTTGNFGRRQGHSVFCGISVAGGSVNPTVQADLVSMDADGFTLDYVSVGSAVQIHYLALGGRDLTDAYSGAILTPTATGDQPYTGIGFRPDLLLFATLGESNVVPGSYTGSRIAIGAATATGQVALTSHTDDQIPTATATIQVTDKCLDVENLAATKFAATRVSMDDDGFTLNFSTTQATQTPVFVLALKGGKYWVGADTQRTSVGTKATTGVGFRPNGLILMGVGRVTPSTKDTNESRLSLGASDGVNRATTWGMSTDNVSTSDENSAALTTKVIRHATNPSTTNAEADLASFDADGFTLDWTTADATAREFLAIAFGSMNPQGVPYVSDPFNRGDAGLNSGGWAAAAGAAGPCQILSNTVYGDLDPSISVFTGAGALPADQWAQVDWLGGGSDSGTGKGFGLVLRCAAATLDCYVALIDSAGTIHVGKYVSGTYSEITSFASAASVDDTLRFEAEGSTLRVFINGTQVGTDTSDSTHTSAGYAGLVRRSSSGNHVDDFHAGSFDGPTAISAVRVDALAASGSVSVTVPADATAAVLLWAHYNALGVSTLSTKTLGGNAFTTQSEIATKQPASDNTGTGVATLTTLPAAGSQTFAWAWSDTDARDEGGGIFIVFVKGVDTADLVRASDTDTQSGGGVPAVTLAGLVTDLTVILYQTFSATPSAPKPAYLLNSSAYNSEDYLVGVNGVNHTGDEGEAPSPTGGDYSTIAAVTVKRATETIAPAEIFEWPGVFMFELDANRALMANILDWCVAYGFKWVAFQCFDDTALIQQTEMERWRDACRARDIYFGLWGVHHDDPSGDATRASNQIDLWGADFYIANAEIEYKTDGPGTRAHSATFCTAFRGLQPDIASALSTYGAIANEHGILGDVTDANAGVMDFKAWYDAGFHILPQSYASDPVYVPDRTVRHHRRCGWPYDRIHPTVGIYQGGATYDGADYHAFLTAPNNTEYEHETRADSPKGLWKMQDASGNPVDMTANGLNMTSVVGTPDYAQPGPFPGASAIRVAGGETLVRSSAVSTLTDNFTLELLVHVQAIGLNDMKIVYNGNSGSNGWGLIASVDRSWRLLAGGVVAGNFADKPIPDRFAHIVLVRRSGAWEIYMDGAPASSAPGSGTPLTPSGTFQVGDSSIQEAVAFLAVYETALSPTRIRAHCEAFGSTAPVCSPVTAYGYSLFLGDVTGVLGVATVGDYYNLGLAASQDRCARRYADSLAGTRVGPVLVAA